MKKTGNDIVGLRVGIKTAGCSGLKYNIEIFNLVFKKYNNPKVPGNKNLPKASSMGFKYFKRYDIAGKDDPQTKIVVKR